MPTEEQARTNVPPPPTSSSPPAPKTYIGYRIGGVAMVAVDRTGRVATNPAVVDHLPMTDVAKRHSPTGFEWGYGGSGPAALAHAILADVAGIETATRLYQEFKRDVVAGKPAEGFALTETEVRSWIAAHA